MKDHEDITNNRQAEQKIKGTLEDTNKERTVIISCSMGARSFSLPSIVAVVNCIDGGALSTAVQRASRCFTPDAEKKIGMIVNYSFNTARSSAFEIDLISSAIQQNPANTSAAIRRVYGVVNFLKKDQHGYALRLEEKDFMAYVTSKDNIQNMALAAVDYDGLFTLDLANLLKNVQTHSSMKEEWQGTLEKAVTYIQTQQTKSNTPDPEAKALRNLMKKIQTIIQCAGNAYYLAPSGRSFQECLFLITQDAGKDQEYFDLVGVKSAVILEVLMDYLPETFLNLIISKASQVDAYDHFAHQHSSHPKDLFAEILASLPKTNRRIVYLAKEPGAGERSDIAQAQTKGTVVVVACLPGYKEYYCSLGVEVLTRDEFFKSSTKADVIIGNPPYQDQQKKGGQNKLYNKFSKTALALMNNTGIVSLVTPISVLKHSKRFSLIGHSHLKQVDFTVKEKFQVGVEICQWIVDASHCGDVTVVCTSKTHLEPPNTPIRNYEHINRNLARIYDSISAHSKVISNRMFKQNPVDTKTGRSLNPQEDFPYPVHKISNGEVIIQQYNKPEPKLYQKRKYVVCISKKFDRVSTLVTTLDFDVNHVFIDIDSEEQIENIESFIFSEYFVSLVSVWKTIDGNGFNNAIKYLPKFDKSKSWTNEEVQHFLENIAHGKH